MSKYVDGFLIPVPKEKMDEYRVMSELSAQVWMDHGALEYVENISEDVSVGEHTSFPRAVSKKDNEVIILAWIIYESRQHRDAAESRYHARSYNTTMRYAYRCEG